MNLNKGDVIKNDIDKIGYITGSFDLLHSDHLRLLKSSKEMCDILIVGLVTDDLGKAQKRLPIMNFAERRSALEATRYVDLVVEHTGDSKAKAYEKLQFDIIFSSDEYVDSIEFNLFKKHYPNVKVVFFPKNNHTSTTKIWERMKQRVRTEDDENVLAIGVGGLIFKKGGFILKNSNVSSKELSAYDKKNDSSSDVLGFMGVANGNLPRNYRNNYNLLEKNKFPMLACVNVFREIEVGEKFKNASWSTYLSFKIIYRAEKNKKTTNDAYIGEKDLFAFSKFVDDARRFPEAILQIKQKDGGMTLKDYLQNSLNEPENLMNKLKDVILIIREICNDLKLAGVVHGDIHCENVLVKLLPDKDELQIFLIDFGWCSSLDFNLCAIEREKTLENLKTGLDFTHFIESLKNDFGSKIVEAALE